MCSIVLSRMTTRTPPEIDIAGIKRKRLKHPGNSSTRSLLNVEAQQRRYELENERGKRIFRKAIKDINLESPNAAPTIIYNRSNSTTEKPSDDPPLSDIDDTFVPGRAMEAVRKIRKSIKEVY